MDDLVIDYSATQAISICSGSDQNQFLETFCWSSRSNNRWMCCLHSPTKPSDSSGDKSRSSCMQHLTERCLFQWTFTSTKTTLLTLLTDWNQFFFLFFTWEDWKHSKFVEAVAWLSSHWANVLIAKPLMPNTWLDQHAKYGLGAICGLSAF